MAEVHDLLKRHGAELTRRLDIDRRVVDAAVGYLSLEDGEIGFIYSGWAQAALPHRKLPDDAPWQIQSDRVSLIVQPGLKAVPGGPPKAIGVPYGSRARLILLFLQSEALRTNSRQIELGGTFHAWLKRLEIPVGGKSMRDVSDQAERISRCRMSFEVTSGAGSGLLNQSLVETAMFVRAEDSQDNLFVETATLGQTFFDQLKKHATSIEEAAIRQLANNSMALDVYVWLAWRLHILKEDRPISWHALHEQFGRGIKRLDHFRKHFKDTLGLALAVYPDAKVDMTPAGVVLKPSRPPVAPRLIAIGSR